MMAQITRFLRMSLFIFRALYAWLSPSSYFVIKFVVPFLQMSLFVYIAKFTLGPEGMAYVAIGNALQFVALNTLMGVAITMVGEKWSGTLQLLLTAPVNRGLVFANRGLIHVFDGVLGATIGLLYANILFGVSFADANLLTLGFVLFFSSLTLTGIGLIIASLSLFLRTVDPIMNVTYLFIFLVAGVNFPVEELPRFLQPFAYMIPLTYGIQAAREVIVGASLQDISEPLLIMFILFLLQAGIGYWIFLRFEKLSKHYGTLDVS